MDAEQLLGLALSSRRMYAVLADYGDRCET